MVSAARPDRPGKKGPALDKTALRDAATLILVRDPGGTPCVLMGQRGAAAAFMPNRFVFPGGAMDAGDLAVPFATPLRGTCAARLEAEAPAGHAHGLAAAAIRELWEETGLILGAPGTWPDRTDPAPDKSVQDTARDPDAAIAATVPADWSAFAERGVLPAAGGLSFVFRAITPPGRPRRFDARFFVADAAEILGDPCDFSAASDELSHLQWIPLLEVRNFHLPFVTEVVLAEVAAALPDLTAPETVPFFDNGAEESLFRRLGGVGPMQTFGT